MRFLYLFFTFMLLAHSGAEARSCLFDHLRILDDNPAKRIQREVTPDKVASLARSKQLYPSQLAYSRLKPLQGRTLEEVEQRLKSMNIVDKKAISGEETANKVYEITLEDGTRTIWKPHTETTYSNYRTEVLAYEYDRKFGFKLVPPTVERTVDGQRGSVQLFMQKGDQMQYSGYDEAKQFLFDFLIANGDRHGKNWFIGVDQKIVSIDNGVSFNNLSTLHRQPWRDVKKIIGQYLKTDEGAVYIKSLKQTDLKKFKSELSDYVGSTAAEEAVERIRFIIKYNDEVVNPVPAI